MFHRTQNFVRLIFFFVLFNDNHVFLGQAFLVASTIKTVNKQENLHFGDRCFVPGELFFSHLFFEESSR